MNFSFHPEAENDLIGAAEWYESQRSGLGDEFAAEIADAIVLVLDFPLAWTEIAPGIRRCVIDRFPYSLVYCRVGEEIVILAVMHHRREPGYWRHRAE